MAVQFARARGNIVTAVSTSAGKEELAKSLGAHHFLVSTDAAAMAKAADSFDLVLVTISAAVDTSQYVSLLRRNGTLCFVGAITKPLSVDPFGPLIFKQIKVTGSATGGRGRITEMLAFAAEANIRPQIELFKFDDINAAIEKVDKNEVRFRAVLQW
jgi:D-arabinose 1-dehydrogenase-like Zn-dependent alcohol dehydrogenase